MYQLGNIEVAAAPPPVGAARNVEPRYNIAPTSTIDVVLPTADGPALVPMRWGSFRRGGKSRPRTGRERRRQADVSVGVQAQRCIIPASGYFKRKTKPDGEQPYFVSAADSGCSASPVFGTGATVPTPARPSRSQTPSRGQWVDWTADAASAFASCGHAANQGCAAVGHKPPAALQKTLVDRGPPVDVETVSLIMAVGGSGRQLFGGVYPVKKHGPWAFADLRVVTLMAIPIRKLISPRSPAPLLYANTGGYL